MHVKSCPKLLRSELRLDLAHHRGALLRRCPSQRVPLAALSTNTLRCCGPAVVGAAARAKENAVFTEDEALDVWTVIKPGHVREKIALFAHDSERKAKGGYDVTAKHCRRTSQIQPALPEAVVTLSLQPAVLAPPVDPCVAPPVPPSTTDPPTTPPVATSDDDSKLSVVEMVAFLEQHVITCSPHAKLRSSASITLSRAPPPPSTAADPHPAPPSVERPIAAQQGEEPESVSVSDMVAKLESQCLRRRTQTERRTVGRVLLAEQNHSPFANFLPISASKPLKATPTPSSTAETRKASISLCKSNVKVKVTPCFSTQVVIKTPTKPTPTLSQRSDAIGRGKPESPPPSSHAELAQFCKSDKSSEVKPKTTQKCDNKERQKSTADILEINANAETPRTREVCSAHVIKAEAEFCDKNTSDPKADAVKSNPSEFETKKSSESVTHEEPMPGLLFLTPPPKPCIQSEQRKAERHHSSSTSDALALLSQDLTAQSQTRTRCSDQSESSSFDSCPIRTLQSKRKAKSDSNLSRCSLVIQSDPSKPSSVQSQNSSSSLSQSEKRKSCSVTASELGSQSETRIELLPLESRSHRRRLNRIAQSEKRKSCPVMVSDWSNSQNGIRLQTLNSDSAFNTSQSEQRKCFTAPPSNHSEACPSDITPRSSSSSDITPRSSSSSDITPRSSSSSDITPRSSSSSDITPRSSSSSDITPRSSSSSDITPRSSSDITPRSSSSSDITPRSSSSSDITPRSSSDITPRSSSSSDITPRSSSSSDITPRSSSSSDITPRSSSSSDITPRSSSSSDITPRSSSDITPRSSSSSDITPRSSSSSDITPRSSSDITPRSSSEVVPRSSSEVVPRSSSEVVPRSSSEVVPRSSSEVVPRSSSEVVPRSSSEVVPRSSSEVVLLRSCSDVGSERRRRRKAARAFSLCSVEGAGRYGGASEDFLLMRRRVQNLLEPRSSLSYLSLLPHHLLLQILLLLPTRALAALKCTCHYLRLVIDTYDPRPRDALWVCDPRYRDDPCKQCKRRHQRGDVSLCRWHHKPFCQAMPYGPGYWMCCHGDRRDAPGCNVGLHDNRWVPAFHSINAPIYRQRPRDEPDHT